MCNESRAPNRTRFEFRCGRSAGFIKERLLAPNTVDGLAKVSVRGRALFAAFSPDEITVGNGRWFSLVLARLRGSYIVVKSETVWHDTTGRPRYATCAQQPTGQLSYHAEPTKNNLM